MNTQEHSYQVVFFEKLIKLLQFLNKLVVLSLCTVHECAETYIVKVTLRSIIANCCLKQVDKSVGSIGGGDQLRSQIDDLTLRLRAALRGKSFFF